MNLVHGETAVGVMEGLGKTMCHETREQPTKNHELEHLAHHE